jgi:signal transduction histidine kinase
MPPPMHAGYTSGLQRYAMTHHSRMFGRPVRMSALKRDGGEVDVELTLGVATLDQGREILVGTLRDLADRVELERKARVIEHMRALSAAAAHLTSLLDVDKVVDVAVETLVSQFGAALARIWLREPRTETLRLRASAGISRRIVGSPRESIDIRTHPFKLGVVARTRRPFAKNGLKDDPQFDQGWVTCERIESAIAFPLLVAGDLQGVLVAFFREKIEEEVLEAHAMLAAMVATAVNDAMLYDRAQRALRARDEVLAIVSHDLRGPLSVIEMGARLLLGLYPEKSEPILRIRRAGQRMSVLIRDLLDVSALEAGRLRMETAEVPVGPLVSEAVELARPLADAKRVQLTADIPSPETSVVCDHGRILQVFANLLGNAIKFTAEGGAVTVRVSEDATRVRFAVADTGVGISETALPHVFDRYWRAERDSAAGVGLGLAIAKGIVDAHHGSIRAESVRGEGATLLFDLPRAPP